MAVSATVPQLAVKTGQLIKGKKGAKLKRSATSTDSDAPFSPEQWTRLIGLVADRLPKTEALKISGITRYALEGAIRTDVKKREQWQEAKLSALRARWDVETLEVIMTAIAMGGTVKSACTEVFREDDIHSLYSLLLQDPIIRELYDDARIIQAEKMAIDDLIEISDETEKDETWDGKANSAAVNRSRLMVDTRKWIAAKLHYKRFGDKVQQDVNANVVIDHAARLEAARKRKEAAYKPAE